MSTTLQPSSPATSAEAARYALLRRLSSSMRHHLVVNLQPIGMIYEVMDRRLRAPTPDLPHVRESAGKINTFARAALAACVDVIGWLAPDEGATTTVQEAARESVGLVATSFSFRGYALRNEVGALPGEVRRCGIRHLLTATLLHCTDNAPAPAEIVLAGTSEQEGVRLTVTLRPATQGDRGIATEPNYRKISWDDVQALAEADAVQVSRSGDTFVLRFPWASAAPTPSAP